MPNSNASTLGTCKVQTNGDVSEISSEEMDVLTPEEIEKGILAGMQKTYNRISHCMSCRE